MFCSSHLSRWYRDRHQLDAEPVGLGVHPGQRHLRGGDTLGVGHDAHRSIAPSRPIRSYQRSVCGERPHFSAASPMLQVVTSSAYELERALTQMLLF